MVRQKFAKLPFAGSIPALASLQKTLFLKGFRPPGLPTVHESVHSFRFRFWKANSVLYCPGYSGNSIAAHRFWQEVRHKGRRGQGRLSLFSGHRRRAYCLDMKSGGELFVRTMEAL